MGRCVNLCVGVRKHGDTRLLGLTRALSSGRRGQKVLPAKVGLKSSLRSVLVILISKGKS